MFTLNFVMRDVDTRDRGVCTLWRRSRSVQPHFNPHDMKSDSTSSTQQRTARSRRIVTTIGSIALAVVVGACAGDTITAPAPVTAAPSNGLIGGLLGVVSKLLTPVTGLLRLEPLRSDVVRSITVDAKGGVLRIPETGLTLTIPANAVSSRTTITVTALRGKAVAYEFKPHGLKFARPIQFTHDLPSTLLSTSSLRGGYFANVSQVNTTTGEALINEEIPARVANRQVTFDISHFSGYMVSTGRSTSRGSTMEGPESLD